MLIRLVLQAVDQASLLVDNESRYARTGRGVVMYIAFVNHESTTPDIALCNTVDDAMQRVVETVMRARIFTHFSPESMATRAQSLIDAPHVDVLIVPQASMGGKLKKDGSMQFHGLLSKDVAKTLYYRFCRCMREARGISDDMVDVNGLVRADRVDSSVAADEWLRYAGRVVNGTFGYRQALRFESAGPFTHFLELAYGSSSQDQTSK